MICDKNLEGLVFSIPKKERSVESVTKLLKEHPEIQFVSYVGIDFGGNGTDERIPIEVFLEDMEEQLHLGVQTDGSSVTLPKIATMDNAKVIILPDRDVDWYIDYNYSSLDKNDKFIGTLIVPSYLVHANKKVCSRSILKKASERMKEKSLYYINNKAGFREEIGIGKDENVEEILLTSATELEFWVKTPEDVADEEKLSTSQTLKEQYWKRTEGNVRSALEKTLYIMQKYGFDPEMGHKEVGGVTSQINPNGTQTHVMEQLEIDWKYSSEIHAADKEIIIRNLVKEVFNRYNLEVTFQAKPIEGVAGSGKHAHIGVAAKLDSGRRVNLFTHKDMEDNYASSFAIASLMGILKNYEVINPFVAPSIDSLNRLKPHFEAPVCIVSSLGRSVRIPSRNRSVLVGLIKDQKCPLATRFELRSPNPLTNVYLVLAASYQAMIDGLDHAGMQMDLESLVTEFSKKMGDEAVYFEKNRQYRSEENVFEYYTEEERNVRFGTPPATVYDNLLNLEKYPDKLTVLKQGDIFTDELIESYKIYILDTWTFELAHRYIENNQDVVRSCVKIHDESDDISDLDIVNWTKINAIRWSLMKDSLESKSVFTRIREAIEKDEYSKVSKLQLEMYSKIADLKHNYNKYIKNIF